MPGEYINKDIKLSEENRTETVSHPEQARIRGMIVRWVKDRGFGIISLADGGKTALCHVNEMCEHIRPKYGQEPDASKPVNIAKLVQTKSGFAAERVECDSCAEPEKWEEQPIGEPVFGVREVKLVCVNKPNSRPGYELIKEANKPFKEAQEKQIRWKSVLNQNFFKEFGEPTSVEVSNNNYLILKYPHGEKKVWMPDAMDSGHWKVSASGEWKEENNGDVTAEFIFDNIPGAKVSRVVASFYPHAHLAKQFDLMPKQAQEAILNVVREKITSPEIIAKERFEAFSKNDGEKEQLENIRDDIIALQAPGEAIISIERRRYTEFLRGKRTDERLTGGGYQTEGDFYFLTTGVHKGSKWVWSPKGVKTFSIAKPTMGETAEDVRIKLLLEKKQFLRWQLENMKKIELPVSDKRLYNLTPQEWEEKYNKQWEKMQEQLEEKWEKEDGQTLSEMKYNHEIYESAAIALEKIREEQVKLIHEAQNLNVNLDSLGEVPSVSIGNDSVELLGENTRQLEIYNAEVKQRIERELVSREELDVLAPAMPQKEAETEIVATPARWYLSDIEPGKLEKYGRKFGEGFGLKVDGETRYLPGDRSVVGINFEGMGNRYRKHVTTIGISPLEGFLVTEFGKKGGEFLGIIEDPNWKVYWLSTKDGQPEKYSLANSKGIGNYFPYENEEYHESKDWDGIEGNGPSAEEIRTVFNLSAFSKDQKVEKEKGLPDNLSTKPSLIFPADNPFGAKLRDAMNKKKK